MEPRTSTRAIARACVGTDERLDAADVFAAAAAVGITEKAVRDCLARLQREGEIVKRSGRGKTAVFEATAAGREALEADRGWVAFSHRIDAGLEPWDGRWHMVSFEISEPKREIRGALRTVLRELGAAAMHAGVYTSAWNLRPFVQPIADQHDVASRLAWWSTEALEFGGQRDPSDVAAALWPLADIARQYAALDSDICDVLDSIDELAEVDLAAAAFAVAVRIDTLMRAEPLLPRELLPAAWPGVRARANYHELMLRGRDRSELLARSSHATSVVAEIELALTETSEQFWARRLRSTRIGQ